MKPIANLMRHHYGKEEITVGRLYKGRSRYELRYIDGSVIKTGSLPEASAAHHNAHPFNYLAAA